MQKGCNFICSMTTYELIKFHSIYSKKKKIHLSLNWNGWNIRPTTTKLCWLKCVGLSNFSCKLSTNVNSQNEVHLKWNGFWCICVSVSVAILYKWTIFSWTCFNFNAFHSKMNILALVEVVLGLCKRSRK